jgi:hypothetical protein
LGCPSGYHALSFGFNLNCCPSTSCIGNNETFCSL